MERDQDESLESIVADFLSQLGARSERFPLPTDQDAVVSRTSSIGMRQARPPMPDPRLLRRIIRQRQLRRRFFDDSLFSDPAWDMLLDLALNRVEHKRVSVTSLCIASGVPATTALRWINELLDIGLIERTQDEMDRRRAFISLTDRAADAIAGYFAELGRNARDLI